MGQGIDSIKADSEVYAGRRHFLVRKSRAHPNWEDVHLLIRMAQGIAYLLRKGRAYTNEEGRHVLIARKCRAYTN